MVSKLFTIHGAPELTKEIHSQVNRELIEKKRFRNAIDKTLGTRSLNVGRLGFLRLQILHREFTGKDITAIRLIVTSARYAKQSVNKIKGQFRRGR